jgi:uncharacterized protein (TIGR02118 family)
MICVSVTYANTPGKKFDHAYYAQTHFALVRSRLKSMGLVRDEIDQGVGGGDPGSAAPYAAIGRLYFNTLGEFQAAMQTHGPEIIADVPNYTDIPPVIQVSQMA